MNKSEAKAMRWLIEKYGKGVVYDNGLFTAPDRTRYIAKRIYRDKVLLYDKDITKLEMYGRRCKVLAFYDDKDEPIVLTKDEIEQGVGNGILIQRVSNLENRYIKIPYSLWWKIKKYAEVRKTTPEAAVEEILEEVLRPVH